MDDIPQNAEQLLTDTPNQSVHLEVLPAELSALRRIAKPAAVAWVGAVLATSGVLLTPIGAVLFAPWIVTVACLVPALLLGAGVTLDLIARIGQAKYAFWKRNSNPLPGEPPPPPLRNAWSASEPGLWWLSIIVCGVSLVLMALIGIGLMPPLGATIVRLLMLIPTGCVLILAKRLDGSNWGIRKSWAVASGFFLAFAGGLFAVEFFGYLGHPLVASFMQFVPGYNSVLTPFIGTFTLTVVGMILAAIAGLWRATSITEQEDKKPATVADDESTDESDARDPLLALVLDTLSSVESLSPPPDYAAFAATEAHPDGNTAPPADDVRYRPFFRGCLPTVDQQRVFDRFSQQCRQLASRKEANGKAAPCLEAILLIHGASGSGRRTVLQACALESVLGAGRSVLYLVADGLDIPAVRRRFERLLSTTGLSDYVSVGALPARPNRHGEIRNLAWPMIAIADLQSAEDLLYGIPLSSHDLPIALRYPTIMVDDLTQMPTAQSAHLPFFLNKHRLLLNAHHVPMHAALVSEPLTVAGRRYLPQVFCHSTEFETGRDVLECRIRQDLPRAWVIHASTAAPRQAIPMLLRLLREGEEPVPGPALVIWDGISGTEREAIVKADDAAIVSGRSATIPDLRSRLIIVWATDSRDLTPALLATAAEDDTIIVVVSPQSQLAEAPPDRITPIYPSPHAQALLAAHYRGLVAQLGSYRPGLRYEWRRFGLDWPNAVPVAAEEGVAAYPTMIDVCTNLDCGTEDEIAAVANADQQLTPVTVDVSQLGEASGAPVRFTRSTWETDADGSESLPYMEAAAFREPDADESPYRPYAVWEVDAHSEPLDLARSRAWQYVHDGNRYGPDLSNLKVLQNRRFTSSEMHGMDEDFAIPGGVWSWHCPDGAIVTIRHGSGEKGFRLASLDGLRASVTARITDLMSSRGQPKSLGSKPFRFDYTATLSAIVFGGDADRLVGERDLNCRELGLAGNWRSAVDPDATAWRWLPAITAAFEYSLNTHLKGFADFGRVFAYELRHRRRPGDIWIWIVEPTGTEYTLVSALSFLIDHDSDDDGTVQSRDQLERSVFTSVMWFLTEARKRQDSERLEFARRISRLPLAEIHGVEEPRRVPSDLSDLELQQGLALASRVLAVINRETTYIQGERFGPDVHVGPVVQPVVTPDTDPIWRIDADVTPWDDCVERLWSQAIAHHPTLASTNPADCDRSLAFIVEASLSDEAMSRAAADLSDSILNCRALKPGVFALQLRPDALMATYCQSITEGLPRLLDSSPPGSRVTLRIWLVDTTALPKRPPSIDDLFHAALVGGLAAGGLIMSLIDDEESQPTPTPEPFPAPTITIPDDIPEADPGSITFTPVTLATPRVYDAPTDGTRTFTWTVDGRTYTCHWGFSTKAERDTYLDLLDSLPGRISCAYFGYLANDPFLGSIHDFANHLKTLYAPGSPNNAAFARYLVRFVQSFSYIRDPNRGTDWPRFPSEFLANNGGDCEDSSLMLAALLAHFGYRFCLLSLPRHMAVGLAGPHTGAYFTGDDGHRYYFVETATNGSELPIGDTSTTSPAELLYYRATSLPPPAPSQILTADINFTTSTLTVLFYSSVAHSDVTVGIFGGQRGKDLQADLQRETVGTLELPPTTQSGTAMVKVPVADLSTTGDLALDITFFATNQPVAHWAQPIVFRRRIRRSNETGR